MSQTPRLLVKLRPEAVTTALAASSTLQPLFEVDVTFGLSTGPATWFAAEIGDLGPNPWDAAYADIAAALGLDASAVMVAEPDLVQSYPDEMERNAGGSPFALSQPNCTFEDQHNDARKPGPGFAWHLQDGFSQLASARAAVRFNDPDRTRIAHIDTGYDPNHSARPARILSNLEHNFVNEDGTPNRAADPNRGHLFDNSGHGTGTIGILAGTAIPANGGQPIGGAPDADILPLRIANSVVMFYTSALASAIQYAITNGCDVVSISMGGLPSAAWKDTVNAAYEAGVCIVAASGDCFGGLPSHHVVYPARYHRCIAACGVMADGSPYYNLPIKMIEGSWGPDSAMTAALASYTPNAPWAKFGCRDIVDMDGAGTSAATPQIAAAVALWYEKYKAQLPRNWRRVEAVRNALFRSAQHVDKTHFGNGILKAKDALAIAPDFNLPKTPEDNDSFAFFRIITGLGITGETPREQMMNLELAQVYQQSRDLQDAVPDPAEMPSKEALKQFMDALIADTRASQTLRRTAVARYPVLFDAPVPVKGTPDLAPARAIPQPSPNSIVRNPPYRRVRTYAVDPSFSNRLATDVLNQGLLRVRWEDLEPGPKGEYIEVVDQDQDGTVYDPVNLNDPRLIAQDGFSPAEDNPQFHQQMVYAVTMSTIEHFERAIGRRVLWRARMNKDNPFDDSGYVQRLRVQPHAFRQENAYYDPRDVGLHFGYFKAAADDPGDHVPGSTVFSCLAHDIVAHECTHAILDGMHRRFNEPTNVDVLAFHEGFADIVALMQHFTMQDLLENQIAQTRGDLESQSILGSLAIQFGRASGKRRPLRDAIGAIDADGVWKRQIPDPSALDRIAEPHARGALLVAAVFDAFLAIYKRRTADLYRIYTGGTGVLRPGAIHPDLVKRLAAEASKSAEHVLHICIRALDYVPPVDITFGEYLRGIITADADLVADDQYGYRVAFVEAFRRRGIYPNDIATLSVQSLRWQGVDIADPNRRFGDIVAHLKKFADECLYIDNREELFHRTRDQRATLHNLIEQALAADPELAVPLGIDPALQFEVHELRRSERSSPDGRSHPQVVLAITQQREIQVTGAPKPMVFHGGSTLIIDLKKPELQYAIRKRISNTAREQSTKAFLEKTLQHPLMAMLLDPDAPNRFAALHALGDLHG